MGSIHNQQLLKYESRSGLIVSESTQHGDGNGTFFIIDGGEKFHTIRSTRELIKKIHPSKQQSLKRGLKQQL